MDLSGNTILITGATSGIGLAFAERLMKAGSTVIICGRRKERLEQILSEHPDIHTRVCDVSDPAQRIALHEWATSTFPQLNILINNAGIQRRVDLKTDEDWETTRSEIAINFDAPIHLSRLFIPHLLKQSKPAIVNVTSGLAFVPMAAAPIYCATKAGLHSFTISLRQQLKDGPIRVIEVVPPAVRTDLGGVGVHDHDWAAPLDEYADSVIADLGKGQDTSYFGLSAKLAQASGEDWQKTFQMMNSGQH